jgi:UDP-N-acetylmuramoyl-tripeptide--D-alanyl-D-alanine ligase
VTALRAVVIALCSAGSVLAEIRWLRVAQREHYLPGSVSRFALRWWSQDPATAFSLAVAAVGVGLAWRWPAAALAPALVAAAGPPGLALRGRSSPLAWTRRLKTLAAVALALDAVALALATLAGVGPLVAGALALAVPLLLDAACAVTAPFERALAHRYVRRAAVRLGRIAPTVVAITGSYGKTSTKGYVAHLLAGSKVVVASPASFNNTAGLARAVNENLAEATEVFVAEMGTYGPGEIADLCSWLVPDIAAITAVGPVHLERFGSEDRILAAKAEILEPAGTVVLNVDDPRLALLADRSAERGKRVRRVSASMTAIPDGPPADGSPAGGPSADVRVRDEGDHLRVFADGREVGRAGPDARPGNVAVAVAVALELGVPLELIGRRLPSLPGAPHRLEAAVAAGGCLVLDDTYNANPVGAATALRTLETMAPPSGRRVVVTPGMVELGPLQVEENASFARAVAAVADDLVVVGRTNRRALLAGARTAADDAAPSADDDGVPSADDDGVPRAAGAGTPSAVRAGRLRCVLVHSRAEAVAWVRDHLGPGDIVLYENDLPDHYP